MKNRRVIAMLMLILLIVPAISIGVPASAAYAYDVDFSIKPDKTEVNAGDTFNVDIVITTRKSGYVEFDFELTYDESLVSCELDSFNQDGYTGDGTAEGTFKLTYKDPSNSDTPTPTKKDSDYSVRVAFKAKEVTKKSNVVFKGKINKLSGVNSLDNNKIKALTPATLVPKNVYVLEVTNVPETTDKDNTTDGETDVTDNHTDEPDLTTPDPIDVPQQIVEEKDNDTMKIALIIIGGLIVFGSGLVVGYILNTKKNGQSLTGGYSKNSYSGGGGSDYGNLNGLGSRTYNNNNAPAGDAANSFRAAQNPPVQQPTTYANPNSNAVPASQSIFTVGNTFVRSNPNPPSNPNANTGASSYSQYGTHAPQPMPQNRPAFSENTYTSANVPKYGTNFEGTYAQYANRQQQMQRTYSQPNNYQMNQPMNGAGTFAPNMQRQNQQQMQGGYMANRAQQGGQPPYYQNNAVQGRYPTSENTAYPTSAQTASAQQNNGGGYRPSQPSSVTGGYKPSNPSNNGYSNRPY